MHPTFDTAFYKLLNAIGDLCQRTCHKALFYGRKEGNVLLNNTLNTFYLWLYGVKHMVKDHSDSERGNLQLPHRLFFLISSKRSFICIIPQ